MQVAQSRGSYLHPLETKTSEQNQKSNPQPSSGHSDGPHNRSQTKVPDSNSVSSAIKKDRQESIDSWVVDNANATTNVLFIKADDDGGERVSKALNGDSSLGKLSPAEQRYLMESAKEEWMRTGNVENIREAGENLNSEESRKIVAEVYAEPSASRAKLIQNGGQILEAPGWSPSASAREEMLSVAIKLDPAAVVTEYGEAAGELPEGIKGIVDNYPEVKKKLLLAVAEGKVDPSNPGVTKMVTAFVLHTSDVELKDDPELRKSISGALAQIMVDRNAKTDRQVATQVNTLKERYEDVLETAGGRELIGSDKAPPEMRGWVIANIANRPNWDGQALSKGWESRVVISAYSGPIIAQYEARGSGPQELSGEALRNTIGQAEGIPPDRLPGRDESQSDQQNRLSQGMNYSYYGDNKQIDTIAKNITEVGGVNAEVTVMPVTVNSSEFGAATYNVYKVKGKDGKDYYIEDVDPSRRYTGFDDWHANSQLPPGQMTYQSSMKTDANVDQVCSATVTEATPNVTDTFAEWARKVGDGVAMGVGYVAGAAIIFGTGGMAAVVGLGMAGGYTAVRSGEKLQEMNQHRVNVKDLSNSEVRMNWIEVASGVLSFSAMGAAVRASIRGVGSGSSVLNGAAAAADATAAMNYSYDLVQQWNNLTPAQRASAVLNIAFRAGLSGAGMRDAWGARTEVGAFNQIQQEIATRSSASEQAPNTPSSDTTQTRENKFDGSDVSDSPTARELLEQASERSSASEQAPNTPGSDTTQTRENKFDGSDVSDSPTARELLKQASDQPKHTAKINYDHVINGEVTTESSGEKRATGGHYQRSPNVRVVEVLSDKDTNGVIEARTMVRDPETGGWIENKSKTTLFPEMWSKRQVKEEVGEAFYNSESISPYEWEGISPSGVTIRGYYKRPEGSALTAWPVYGKVRH